MSVREAAEALGVSVSTVYRRIRSGKLSARKVNRRWVVDLPQASPSTPIIVDSVQRDGRPKKGRGGTRDGSESRPALEGPMNINVDWRAVSHNTPSKNMKRSVPWVHGVIRNSQGPSPRIELAPKRAKGDHFPVHLVLAHPDQSAAEAMGWDDALEITVDGHAVSAQKSLGPCYEWAEPEPWALTAEIDADHPLVVHAAEAAKGPQEALRKAEDDFYAKAREWMDRNFPHPDFMNTVRDLMHSEWNGKDGYWPGDPLPDFETIMGAAKDSLR